MTELHRSERDQTKLAAEKCSKDGTIGVGKRCLTPRLCGESKSSLKVCRLRDGCYQREWWNVFYYSEYPR